MHHFTRIVLLVALLAGTTSAQRAKCEVQSYGKSCGPTYTGKVTPTGNTNFVQFTVANVKPGAHIFIIVGAVKMDFPLRPIFGGNLDCRLYTKMSFVQKHVVMKNGTYVWGHALPSTNTGIAYTQAAVIVPGGTPEILTSNGVQLTCK